MAFNVAGGETDTLTGSAPPIAEGEAAKKIEGRSPWRLAAQRLLRDRASMIALGIIILIILIAILAPVFAWLTGHGVNQQFRGPNPPVGLSPTGAPVGPSRTFLLGTDDQGRDILVRIAYGTRVSLFVGLVATAIIVVVGTLAGLAAGYFGKLVDTVLARLMDWLLAFPFLLLAIALISVHGPGLVPVIIVLGLFGWASVGRIVRGQVLSIREREYVEAARALGARPWRIMLIDVLPNLIAQILVYASLLIPVTIVAEASLSFLGVGIPPPTPDWGAMINEGSQVYLYGQWWLLLFPSLALLITTLAFNIFGDGVRDAFDPRGDLFV
ncbi:MAG TPA: ABC transporter permease [Streptosporangiaceae bacterium]